MGARLEVVLVTELESRGEGKDLSDPVRIIRQYWSADGQLLAEVDPHLPHQQLVQRLAELEQAIAEANCRPPDSKTIIGARNLRIEALEETLAKLRVRLEHQAGAIQFALKYRGRWTVAARAKFKALVEGMA